MDSIKAVRINADDNEITWVDVPIGDGFWDFVYALCNFSCGDMVRTIRGNYVVVDDEGLMKEPKVGFILKDYPQPLAGNAIIIGPEVNEKTTNCNLTDAEIKQMIRIVRFKPRVE